MPSVKTKSIKIGVSAPPWMGSEVVVERMHARVQTILSSRLSCRSPGLKTITTAIVEAYIAGYGDGRGLLEHEAEAEEHAQKIADVIVTGEGGANDGVEGPDFLAIAAFVRRVASIIEQRGLVRASAGAPKGPPS